MKNSFMLLCLAMTAFSAQSQVPKPGYGDTGCPEKSLFDEHVPISKDDFIEVNHLPSYGNASVYAVRIYADGRLLWHGKDAVRTVGEASGVVDATQAKALIAEARTLGFGRLCD